MSASEEKKTKRRRQKGGSVVKTQTQTCQSFPGSLGFDMSNSTSRDILSPSLDSETMKKLEKLMDAKDDSDLPQILNLSRGPNPYLDKERCLLCGCERKDSPDPTPIPDGDTNRSAENALAQLPLWVCAECRKATEQGIDPNRNVDLAAFMDADLPPEPSTLPFLEPDLDSEPVPDNNTVCNCEACTERRQIETEHDRETQELQNCWTELRKLVRMMYGRREGDIYEEDENVPDEEFAQELVHRLCARDPHQLFLRLESQVREFVIEMKVKLLKQLNSGYKSPPEAKAFIQLLLDEYGHLCVVARKMAQILDKLKTDHLAKFNVTWELHNKHLFQSIAYTEPSIQSSLHLIISQLRLGAASKESYHEDTYPNLLHRYLKFDDEMSVISVVWRDSHQLIEQYNEEQATLKLKQKMLKEDWEFFKAQRKILEDQVSKNSKSPVSHNTSFEAQFTETMRLMLQGTKPGPEECHCPRCNRKRCPCDECTITHMITCGIINPEALESSNTSGHPNFLHDPNRYRIDVSPPSMSSTTSSSGSSSPLIPERLTNPFDGSTINNGEVENDNENSQSNDGDNEGDDEDENLDMCDMDLDDDDDDEKDKLDDVDIIDGDDDEKEKLDDMDLIDTDSDDDDEECDDKGSVCEEEQEDEDSPPSPGIREIVTPVYLDDPEDEDAMDLISSEKCDCYHCVSQAQTEQMIKLEENSCQCYVCLRQQGKTVSTSLPQTLEPETSRPAELHLYPHIHGSPNLHTLANHHVPPLLPTQLYDLHMPIRQPKSLLQTTGKVPLKLDFDSPEGIHDHIYHAYGDWDNTYDTRMLLPKYSGLSTDLLPPPPLTTNFSTANFLSEPFSVATQMGGDTISTSTLPTSAFNTSVNHHVSLATSQTDVTNYSHDHTAAKISRSDISGHSMSPPCTRPVTLGGNISQQKQTSVSASSVAITEQKQHSQHCKRHNSNLMGKNNANCQSHNNNTSNSNLPVKVSQDFIAAARNIRENAKEGMQMIRQFANSLNTNVNNNTHSCSHNSRTANHIHQQAEHNHTVTCPNATPASVNNVSVGTSTVCMEPNCDNHCDENCDSVDDSCSEQSSSTSTSNQKEGKYCDCCYCEFFGHGNPPVAPTSKNYEEMRNRLRLRLKRKNEKKQEPHHQNCIMSNSNHNNNSTPPPKIEELVTENPVDTKGLDELLKFINGTENKDPATEKSSKALKRARQKQRKAEEKARLEAERLRKEQEKAEKERQKLALIALKESEKAAQKKRKKKKAKSAEMTNGIDTDLNLVREPPAGKEDDTENTKNSAKKSLSNSSQPVGKVKVDKNPPVTKAGEVGRENVKLHPPSEPQVNGSQSVTNTQKAAKTRLEFANHVKSSLPESNKKVAENRKVQSANSGEGSANNKAKSVIEDISDVSNKRAKKSVPNQNNFVTPISQSPKQISPRPNQQTQQPVQSPRQQRQQSSQKAPEQHIPVSKPPPPKQMVQSPRQTAPQVPRQQVPQSPRQLPKSPRQQTTHNPRQPTPDFSKQTSQQPRQVPQTDLSKLHGQQVRQIAPQVLQQHVHSPSHDVKVIQPPPNLHPPFSKIKKISKPEEKTQTLADQLIARQPPLPQKHVPRPNGIPANFQQNHIIRPAVMQNGKGLLTNGMNGVMFRPPPPSFLSPPAQPAVTKSPEEKKPIKIKAEDSPPDQGKGNKNKKKNKKNRNSEDLSVIDEIFMPKAETDLDPGDMDEVEKELEEFKRFCLDSTPVKREKLQVNMNLKDIFVKKKSGLGCS